MKTGFLAKGAASSREPEQRWTRETLLDFFDEAYQSPAECVIFDDGYRSRSYSYEQVRGAAYTFAARLRRDRIVKSEKILFWSENRPEWIVALWGCLAEGVIVVSIDYRSSSDLARRIRDVVHPRALLVGDDVTLDSDAGVPVWRMGEIDWGASEPPRDRVSIESGDTAEIIFTSGATADPKGVVITHRNVLANIIPIEREIATYRLLARPFSPIRFLNLLPLSHMFGQAMSAFVPPMLTGVVILMRGYNPLRDRVPAEDAPRLRPGLRPEDARRAPRLRPSTAS